MLKEITIISKELLLFKAFKKNNMLCYIYFLQFTLKQASLNKK